MNLDQKFNFYAINRATPFDTSSLKGYQIPQNRETGQTLPYCCERHEKVSQALQEWFVKFPTQKGYESIRAELNFKKENYAYLPEKILHQLVQTEFFIEQMVEKEDWFTEITDYIEYQIQSFGFPPVGVDAYGRVLEHYLQVAPIVVSKRQKIIAFLKTYSESKAKKNQAYHEFIEMNAIFQKWLKFFPDLPMFEQVKQELKEAYPVSVFVKCMRFNKYLNIHFAEYFSHKEMLKQLTQLSKQLLASVKSSVYFKNASLDEVITYKEQLEDETHEKAQDNLLTEYATGEGNYRLLVEKWLRNEEAYIQKLEQRLTKNKGGKYNPNKLRPSDPTFIQLFKHNQERVDLFFKLLKSQKVSALDKDNNWVYNKRKSSIVACFNTLEELDFIRIETNKAALYRCIATKIHFKGNIKLFRNNYNPDDYAFFERLLKQNLK